MKWLKYASIQTSILYVLVYIIYTFIKWDIENPFEWIINLPKYCELDRAMILFGWVIYWVIKSVFWIEVFYSKKDETKQ